MPTDDEAPERSVGAMAGPATALNVGAEGLRRNGMRPADWNSGDNNNQFYPDPGELAWERVKQMEAERETQPEGAANGSAAMPEPAVPKRKRGRPPKSHSDAGARASGGDHVRVSDVPRRRDPDEDRVQETRKPPTHRGRETAEVSRDLAPKSTVAEAKIHKLRLEANLGFDAFETYVQEAPLKDAFTLYNEYSRRLIDAGTQIEARRTAEKQSENACNFCDHVFSYRGTDTYKARRAFDLPDGRIQVVMACNKSRCIEAFDDYVNDMSMKSRATLRE